VGHLSIDGSSGRERLTTHVIGLSCLVILLAACFGGVLFRGEQFAFRDSAHYFYPLYERVQDEWSAGRLPIWEPGENGGTPVLGNPTAAVVYPGKLIFALVPYDWGLPLYVVAHQVMAFAFLLVLVRSWGVSWTGAYLAGFVYAFGGPVLSDYFNVIYLVGAAWTPLAIWAADRWLRLGRRAALVALALVLAMQILGGDPESAYLIVLCAFGYALDLARSGTRAHARRWPWVVMLEVLVSWHWVGPVVAQGKEAWGTRPFQATLLAFWAVGILLYIATRRHEERRRLSAMLLGLAASCALAAGVAAVQILPALDNISQSVRWSGPGALDRYELSLLPYRIVEWIWPNVFGSFFEGNRYWAAVLPPTDAHRPVPLSMYMGALPVLLAVIAAGFGKHRLWRRWMIGIAIASLVASFGEFAGLARWSGTIPPSAAGDDSFYGLCTTILPAFDLFRFPSKLLVLWSAALAVLTGLGWDRIAAGVGRRRVVIVGSILLAITVLALAASMGTSNGIALAIAASPHAQNSVFGPIDARGAVGELVHGLGHGFFALAAALAVVLSCKRSPRHAGLAAMALLTVDLVLANSGLVLTIPQTDFNRIPEVVQAIRAAESVDPSPGPFRVHRLDSWVPIGWSKRQSADRLHELVGWEIDTLQPKFGLIHGVSYVLSDESETGRPDYQRFFQPVIRRAIASWSASLGIPSGQGVLYFPRRAFDLWGARYFILPSYPAEWTEPSRGYASFLDQTEMIYPDPAAMLGPEHNQDRERWLETHDVQVRRNKAAFPRAWIVHSARLIRPPAKAAAAAHGLVARLGFRDEPGRDDRALSEVDLASVAYIETEDRNALADFLPGPTHDSTERAAVKYESPTRVVIETVLDQPGLVVLADAFDTNWRLSIDDRPAQVLKANLLMRAAAVAAGSHTLVYSYDPPSVRAGIRASLASFTVLASLAFLAVLRPQRSQSGIATRSAEDDTMHEP
jgi:hypothetical protein